MKPTVLEMSITDRPASAQMRVALWPEETLEAHAKAIDELLESSENWGLVAEPRME